MKHLLTLAILLTTALSAIADDQYPGFIAAGAGNMTSQGTNTSSDAFDIGVALHGGGALEIERTNASGFNQTTGRLIADVFSLGNHSITIQASISQGKVSSGGQSASDHYLGYGFGYNWRIMNTIDFRVMHNEYRMGNFSGADLGIMRENTASLAWLF